jgi:hypothetical protein
MLRKSTLFLKSLWLCAVLLAGVSAKAQTGPCDLYASGGTPCVAAHSTTRALFGGYAGRLYQVQRQSDNATTDVKTLSRGGYANAAIQDSFCAGTTCLVTILYDQTSRHNDLTIEGNGGAAPFDFGSKANALPIVAGGHAVYGLYISSRNGYRNNATSGVATGGNPEGMYMVASGTHVNDGCCFDYGNAETNTRDTGNGHMDAVNLSTTCYFSPCTGSGPWVEADLENGLFMGNGSNLQNVPANSNFVTAMLKNDGRTRFALKSGNAQSGGLASQYAGTLPTGGGYIPMSLEGAIVLGTGGDNSNWSVGSFFEGVMVSGYPSDATEAAVQANIVAAGYGGDSRGGEVNTVTGPGMKCMDVAGDDVGGNGANVQLWDCQTYAVDQHWQYNLSDNTFRSLGRCLDIKGNGTAAGTGVELWDCNGVGGQRWIPRADGSILNPQSGLCLDTPDGIARNGNVLRIWGCNGAVAQQFKLNGVATVPGAVGVTFFQDVNFGGSYSAPKGKGDYPTLPADIPNDWVSSLKIPGGWTVDAYPDANFGGTPCTFTSDTRWVGSACNDTFSSFRIH